MGPTGVDFALTRYHADGSLDTSFDGDGLVTTSFTGNGADIATRVAVQADGRIVLAGYSYNLATGSYDFAVARYHADGSPDTSFDGDGRATTNFSAASHDIAHGVAVQADGRIVVAGYTYNPASGNYDAALARYQTNGALDASFDGNSWITTDFGSYYDFARALALQADGKVVVVGNTSQGGSDDLGLARYNTDGRLDPSFDGDGKAISGTAGVLSLRDFGRAVAVRQPDGKIVVAGESFNPVESRQTIALARYRSDGSLDPSFDGDGRVLTRFGANRASANAVALQGDGKIVVAGWVNRGRDNEFAVARFNADGSPDMTFDGDGLATVTFDASGSAGYAYGLAVQTDGKIVAAGETYIYSVGRSSFALARLNPNGGLDTSFDGDGKVTTNAGARTFDHATSVAVQADGKIVSAGGSYSPSGGATTFALARYRADGSLDTSFDGDGKVTTSIGGAGDVARGVAVQADGKVVVAGYSYNPATGNSEFAAARYRADGSLDASFDGDGRVTTGFGASDDHGSAVAVQADGKVVVALHSKGLRDEAVAEYREALRLRPGYAKCHYNLGYTLQARGQVDDAIAEYRAALAVDPRYALALTQLGIGLAMKGQGDEAIAAYREAIRVAPNNAMAQYNLGLSLTGKGLIDEAIAAYREAIRLNPDAPRPHCNLGLALQRKGQFTEALAALRRGHELSSRESGWKYPSAQWVKDGEALIALDQKLPAILRGDEQPATMPERLDLAWFCRAHKQFPRAAARMYQEAFAAEPQAANEVKSAIRYNAACAAAQAGTGRGLDAGYLDESERARWRQQALDWLRADLALRLRLMDQDAQVRSALPKWLRHWQRDPNLSGVRDEAALARLPEDERKAWHDLWTQVEQTLALAQTPDAKGKEAPTKKE